MELPALFHVLEGCALGARGDDYALCHVHAGLAVYLLFQISMGTRRGALPALAVLALCVTCDALVEYGGAPMRDWLRDMALTMFWPVLLMLVNRYRWRVARARVQRNIAARPAPAPHPPRLRVFPGYARSQGLG